MSEPSSPPIVSPRRPPARSARAQRLDVGRWHTVGLAETEARNLYLDGISHVLETTFLATPFHAQMSSAFLGALHVVGSTISPRRSERTSAQIAKDRYDGIGAQVTIAGRAVGNVAGRRFSIEPGCVMLMDFAQPFVVVDEEERTTVHVSFPRAMLLPRYGDPRDLHCKMLDPSSSDLLGSHMQACARRLGDLTETSAAALGETLLNLFMTVLDAGPATGPERPVAKRDLLAARARRLVEARLGSSDLTPDRLMAQLNISRSDLYGLFEEAGGVSRYIWRRRLEAARDALADPSDSRRIGEIAFAFGFSSEAHFSRAYRQAFAVTPSAGRRAARSSSASQSTTPAASPQATRASR